MRADRTRRLLVFAVCAVGVGALYVFPGIVGPPSRVDDGAAPPPRGPVDRSTPPRLPARADSGSDESPRVTTARTTSARTTSARTTGARTTDARTTEATEEVPGAAGTGEPGTSSQRVRRPSPPASAPGRRPSTGQVLDRDRTPPQPVQRLRLERTTPDTVTVRWSPARDDVAVVGYRVSLNGFEVADTAGTRATVDWFNDDTSAHVLQVLAVDAAGNHSDTSPTLLVTRPSAVPAPNPAVEPRPTPAPPEPSDTPAAQPSPGTTATTPVPSPQSEGSP